MTAISIQEAQRRLPELIHNLSPGDDLIVTEYSQTVARLSRSDPKNQWPCKAGSAKGRPFWMAPDFVAPLEEFKEYME